MLLVTIGTVMIYSSSSILATEKFHDGQFFLKKQLFFLCLGLMVMFLVTKIPYYKLRKLAWPGIAASGIFLCALWIPHLGIRAGGAVRWQASVELLAGEGVTTFVEVGPGTVLSGLVRKIAKGARVLNVDSPESLEAAVAALGAGTEG